MAKQEKKWKVWADAYSHGYLWGMRSDGHKIGLLGGGVQGVSISCYRPYTSEVGALKAARRFAAKHGIRIEE